MKHARVLLCASTSQFPWFVWNILGCVIEMWLDGKDVNVDIFWVGVVARPGVAVAVVVSATTKCDETASHLFTTVNYAISVADSNLNHFVQQSITTTAATSLILTVAYSNDIIKIIIITIIITSCARGDTICLRSSPVGAQAPRAPPSRRNVAVLSHAEYVPTLTTAAALRVKAALSKAA